jgi:hypothetical protein
MFWVRVMGVTLVRSVLTSFTLFARTIKTVYDVYECVINVKKDKDLPTLINYEATVD